MSETKPCPYCAEEIRGEAVRCPFCRSRLAGFDVEHWHRSHADSRLAGVAAAVAHALSVPVGLVRLVFVVATFVNLLGPLVYLVLWAVIPPIARGASRLEQALATAQEWARGLAGSTKRPRSPAGARTDGAVAVASGVDDVRVSPRHASVIHHGGDGER